METKKIILKDIKGLLSRDEMKKIKGGSGYYRCVGIKAGQCTYYVNPVNNPPYCPGGYLMAC